MVWFLLGIKKTRTWVKHATVSRRAASKTHEEGAGIWHDVSVLRLRHCYREAERPGLWVRSKSKRCTWTWLKGWLKGWALQVLAEINPDQAYSLPSEHFLKFIWSLRLAQSRNSEPNSTQAKVTYHTHTHPPPHTPTSKHSSNPGKITICPHIHRISLQRCHDAFLWGKPDTPLASLSAPSWPAAPPGHEALQGPAAAWHPTAPHWEKRCGTPSLPPAHSTTAREQAVAAS